MKRLRFLLAIPALLALMTACNSRNYPEVNAKLVVGDWGVVNNSKAFGQFDSLYYLINPIANLADSIYYNGNYTDSYYRADSMRVMLRYTSQDSIIFCIDRMYAVQTNPNQLLLTLTASGDSLTRECSIVLSRDPKNGDIYTCGPDSSFRDLLLLGIPLEGYATNTGTGAESAGTQNYMFRLDTRGFDRALSLADSLNHMPKSPVEKEKKFKF